MLPLAVIAGVAGAVAAPAGAGPSGSGSAAGIFGRVLLGPPCPVSLEVQTCREHPLRARIAVIRTASGRRVATLQSDENGRFRRALPPGRYRLTPQRVGSAKGTPITVRVHPDRYTRVTIRYRA